MMIIIIMVIFKRLSLKALSALDDYEGGGGRGKKIITQMFLYNYTSGSLLKGRYESSPTMIVFTSTVCVVELHAYT